MTKTRWTGNGDVVVTAFAEYRTGSEEKGYIKHKEILSKTVIYKDYDYPEKHMTDGLKIFTHLNDVYQYYPDGEVTISMEIKEPCVNL